MRTAHLVSASVLAAVASLAAAPAPAYASGGARNPDALKVSPLTAAPGATVTVHTAACGSGSLVTGDASAIGAGAFLLAPGSERETAVGSFRVPTTVLPGTYEIVATCSHDHRRVTADLAVTPAAVERHAYAEVDHGATADGGLPGPVSASTVGGIAALGAAAAGVTWLLQRRVRGTAY
ncbi:hypothetical protein [Streptomyces odontomachi]|uniref:hypothetical protein n=1 Tax=Streptomyces odontomachi TaxID=2944940 RepID=UPI00210E8C90|nr:hypothetical protein [Streptomyces sp. ODS25]